MEEIKEKTADLADHVEDLAETFYRLAMVNVAQKTSQFASGVVVAILLVIFGFLLLFFGGLALGWWLGTLVNSRALGFLLTAGFFLLLVICISLLKKKTIIPMIRDMVVKKMYE